MAILADHQYTLDTFFNLQQKTDVPELSEEVIEKINILARLVGAPSYKKTPIFKHRIHNNPRRRHAKNTITEDDWEAMRNFKTTEFIKTTDGIEKEIENIRSQLNKITAKNYEDIRGEIITILNRVVEMDAKESELERVGAAIFEIGSVNKFWSKLYANLYKDLLENFNIMRLIYRRNFDTFIQLFNNIRYVNSEEDYDLFCEVNKENEKRRAMSCFFVHLMNNGVISKGDICALINDLICKFKDYMLQDGYKNEVNEIGENLVVLIRNSVDTMSDDDEWDSIEKFAEEIAEISHKKYPSMTSKTIFKFMDLMDDL